jgi:tRNA A-37 threonylcarbamoyl transferase component Bud32
VIGTTIGNFEVERLIAEGGAAKVYLARHAAKGGRATVKVLAKSGATDAQVVGRCLNEARAVMSMRHPNIAHVWDLGVVADGAPYVVTEYLEGEMLSAVLARGTVVLAEALDWARQIAIALVAAHREGVFHHELSPDTLLLVPDGRRPGRKQVKVLDFGIAKLQGRTRASGGVRRQVPRAGRSYLSPEHRTSVKDLDARSDVYSLGVILYELVTGQHPARRAVLASPRSLRSDLPILVEALIMQALATSPTQRQSSMAEILWQLELARDSVCAVGVSRTAPPSELFPRTARTPTYDRSKLVAFLAEIDEMLDEPVPLEIVGGAAALLAYGAEVPTGGIDTFVDVDRRIAQVIPLTAQRIPLSLARRPRPPFNYEERRQRLSLGLRNLVIWVPDRHDLLLMKMLRASDRDLSVAEEMHRARPFNLEQIVERYNHEIGHAISSDEASYQGLQRTIERLFGASKQSLRRIA